MDDFTNHTTLIFVCCLLGAACAILCLIVFRLLKEREFYTNKNKDLEEAIRVSSSLVDNLIYIVKQNHPGSKQKLKS